MVLIIECLLTSGKSNITQGCKKNGAITVHNFLKSVVATITECACSRVSSLFNKNSISSFTLNLAKLLTCVSSSYMSWLNLFGTFMLVKEDLKDLLSQALKNCKKTNQKKPHSIFRDLDTVTPWQKDVEFGPVVGLLRLKQSFDSLITGDVFAVQQVFSTGCVIPPVLDDPHIVNPLHAALPLHRGAEEKQQTSRKQPRGRLHAAHSESRSLAAALMKLMKQSIQPECTEAVIAHRAIARSAHG